MRAVRTTYSKVYKEVIKIGYLLGDFYLHTHTHTQSFTQL